MDKAKYAKDGWLVSAIIAKQVCDELNDKFKQFTFNYTIEKKYIHIYFTFLKEKYKVGFIHQETLDFYISRNANGYLSNKMNHRVKFKNLTDGSNDVDKVAKYIIKSKFSKWIDISLQKTIP